MCNAPETPKTLFAASALFADEDKAHAYFAGMRWPNGVRCPRCGSEKVGYIQTRRVWDCYDCQKAAKAAKKAGGAKVKTQFSVKTNTLLEESKLKVGTWLVALWLIVNAKNGISSHELHRAMGITQKTAWFLSHRIREALRTGTFDRQLEGEVEVDEKRVGGAASNMHHHKWKDKIQNRVKNPYQSKALVLGMYERGGELRTTVVPTLRRTDLEGTVRENVRVSTNVYTDAHSAYNRLNDVFRHGVVDHGALQYVKGRIHVNSLENFWALFARCIVGTHVAIEPAHLFRYVAEETWRFNARKRTDGERFVKSFTNFAGRRLDYKTLTDKTQTGGCSCSPVNNAESANPASGHSGHEWPIEGL